MLLSSFVNGLFAGDQIDNRQPPHAERYAGGYHQALLSRVRDGSCARTWRAADPARRQAAGVRPSRLAQPVMPHITSP